MTEPDSQTAPTPKFAILAGISGLLLAGMVSGAALWIIAAITAGILLFANFFLPILVASDRCNSGGCGRGLKVGSRLPIEVKVTNHSRIPVLWLLVEDLIPTWATIFNPPTLQIEGDRVKVFLIGAGKTCSLNYEIKCNRRGYFQIGPTVMETGDLMGMYRRYRVGTQPHYITVLPNIVTLNSYEIGSRRPIGEIRMRDNIMDDPTRLRGIRQWQAGDPMRSVHWAATARTGTLHSKIYEPSSIIGATLILDLHTSSNPKNHEPIRSDLAITAAASIAHSLHDANEPFGLATNGRDAADRIRLEGWTGDHRVRDEADPRPP